MASRRTGMTLIELLGCSVLLAVGLAVAVAAGKHYGWLGAVVGFLVGFVGAYLLLFLLVAIAEMLWLGGPKYPPCHNGCCKWRERSWGDYEIKNADGDMVLRCRCGRDYDQRGRRFMERLPDGTFKPYMVHRPFRGWFLDPDA
ncbi:hypothetical protein LLH23_21900 [bacterium]|nr:hypothetical protein [bacterium]